MNRSPWTTTDDMRAHIGRRWERGRVLAPLAVADDSFPIRLPLKAPSTTDLAARFDEARAWITAARSVPHVRVVWRSVNHRQLGPTRCRELWIDTADDAAARIGHGADVRRFRKLVAITAERRPALLALLARQPIDAPQ